jgi:IS1 family transposase
VWAAIDLVTKRLLAIDVGARTLAMAEGFVHQVVQMFAPGCVPLFLTDGFKEYATALLTHFGPGVQPPRHQDKGPHPKPRWMPLPQLRYAQVIKTVRCRSLVEVTRRVVFETQAAVDQVLAAWGWQINTAFVERLNLSLRQHAAAIGRRVTTLCRHETGLRQQLVLYQSYDNFCLQHASLRLPLPQPEPDERQGLSQAVATLYARDGRWPDGSRLDVEGSVTVSGTPVAAAPSPIRGVGKDDDGEVEVDKVCPQTGKGGGKSHETLK